MKKYLLVLLGVVWSSLFVLFAENVPADRAQQIATRFAQRMDENQLRSAQPLQLVYTARPSLRSGIPEAYYYVFNRGDNNGFVIISGDDRAIPVLGYTESGDFNYEKIPDNMKWWLQEYADQIQFISTNQPDQDEEARKQWAELQTGANLTALRSEVRLNTASWNQGEPYNNMCPMVNGKRAVTGCVATAMAIVMKYHEYPTKGSGSHSYTDKYGNTYSASFTTSYNWSSMLNAYNKGSYTTTQANAVAELMYHCGVSCEMAYDSEASSAYSGNIAKALSAYFGYDKSACLIAKGAHSESEWNSLLKEELDNNRPVPYSGSGSGGHAFVFDGYNNLDKYYVNWGWGGYANGWFALSSLTPAGSNYSSNQDMTIHIMPDQGGSAINRLMIADYDGEDSKGLVLASTPINKDNFIVNLSTVICEGSSGFSDNNPAIISIAHIDAYKNIKEVVSNGFKLTPSPGSYYSLLSFKNCKITKTVVKGDQLCVVYKVGTGDYQIIKGTSNLPTRINLTDDTPSTTYKVTWNTLTGVTLKPESGYNASSIAKGGTFKFKITAPTDKKVVVKKGSTLITPDNLGVYTLTNIQTDIQLTITLEDNSEFTITMPSSVSGVIIKKPDGFTGKVKKGDSFTFEADPASDSYAVGVKVDGKYIYRECWGSYANFKVNDIQKDIVIEIEAINISSLNTTKTVTATGGNLKTYFTDRECCYIRKLIVKGSVNNMDMIFMRSNLPEIRSIDLSEAIISGNKLMSYDLCFIYKLTEVILPASITEIENNAFCYNKKLTKVIMNRATPPILGSEAFTGILISQLTIVVPAGAGSAYRDASVWKNYKIEEAEADTEALRNSTTLQITDDGSTPGLGMITDRSSVSRGDQFNIDIAFLKNISTTNFDALVGIALVDKNNVLKEVIGKMEYFISKGYVNGFSCIIPCKITKEIVDTDMLKVVESTNSGNNWQIVQGNNSSLKVKGQNVNWCSINMPISATGVKIQVLSEYPNKVVKGRSFSFKADPTSSAYAVSVRIQGVRLERSIFTDSYGISYILQNQNITIKGINLSTVNTTKTVHLATAGTLKSKLTDDEMDYLQTLILTGNVSGSDLSFISYLPEITKLDLSGAKISDNTLSSYKLSSSPKLTELILPASVTTIENSSLSSCKNLTRVEMKGSVPPQLGSEAFNYIPVSQLTIVVPTGAGSAYRNAPVWKNYKIVEVASSTYTVTLPSLTGFEVKTVEGYDASSVAKGADFKFSITPKTGYEQHLLTVYTNNKLLTPSDGTVYTILNVTENQIVKIEATPPGVENTYRIFSEVDEGATLVPESGYDMNTVKEGEDFKFRVVLDVLHRDWDIRVQVDGVGLSPDAWGVYTLSDIRSDKNIGIVLSEVFSVTFVKPKEDVKMEAVAGYDPEKVLAGNDFKFRLVSQYKTDQLEVRANGVMLYPLNSVYTIYDINENKGITVTVNSTVGNEELISGQIEITVRGYKLCIKHPEMKNIPLYITSFNGAVVKTDMLNGVYTEINLPSKGAYVISFDGFSRKIIVK